MTTTISTTLTVTGRFEPDEFSVRVGLVPAKIWRAGEPRRLSPLATHSKDGWTWNEGPRSSLDVGEEIARLLERLQRAPGLMAAIQQMELGAQVCVGVDVEGNQLPSISLTKTVLSDLVKVGWSLDIDIVLVGE